MFSPSSRVRVYVCREAVDMRKSFAGLTGLVRGVLERDPLSGHAFLFLNRSRNYVKVLWWDETGYCIHAKRLAQGTFSSLSSGEIDMQTLFQLLSCVELKSVKSRAKYKFIREK